MSARRGGLGRGLDSLIPNINAESTKPEENKTKSGTASTAKKTVKKTGNNNSETKAKTEVKAKTETKTKTESKVKTETKPKINPNEPIINSEGNVVKVSISKVEPDRNQPRKIFDKEKLEELSESIKQYGIITPLIVRNKGDYYELIAGERRWRAANIAGLKEVPVIVRDYEEQEAVEVSIIENIQREDLNPIEEAKAYSRLIKEFKLRQEDIANRVSKNRSTITNSLRLLKLCEPVQEMLVEGRISEGHARTLISLPDDDTQKSIAEQIESRKLTVRDAEKMVKNVLNPKKQTKKPVRKDKDVNDLVYKEFEEQLQSALGTKVNINRKTAGKGSIEIQYYSMTEFERIIEILKASK